MRQVECKFVWDTRRTEEPGEQVLVGTGENGLLWRTNEPMRVLPRRLGSAIGELQRGDFRHTDCDIAITVDGCGCTVDDPQKLDTWNSASDGVQTTGISCVKSS